jgi:hypothetical protein
MSDLVQRPEKDRAIPPEYRPSLVYNFETCFGQFKQVHELIIGRKLENTKFMSRAYFLFVTERFVSSIIIVLVGKAMRFGSVIDHCDFRHSFGLNDEPMAKVTENDKN